jgi:hypothetical protein
LASVSVGFAISGLGTSVLSPQLSDAAALAPGPVGSGFRTLFVGHRSAALIVPLAIGSLANTTRFSVGSAMAIIAIPTVVALIVTARIAISGKPTVDAAHHVSECADHRRTGT